MHHLIFRRPIRTRIPLLGYRNFSHKLDRVRRYIQNELNDGHLNEMTLREANELDPKIVIRAIETCYPNSFPKTEGLLREYLRALALTNNLDNRNLKPLLVPEPTNSTDQALLDAIRRLSHNSHVYLKTDDKNPVHVLVGQPPVAKTWRLLRGLAGAGTGLLLLGACYTIITQNVTKSVKHTFKVVNPADMDTTFADVKGCDEVKSELDEIVEYLRHPEKFDKLGAKLPKGVLLAGAPGSGKTLLARAIAGEAGVAFIQVSGSEFEEMFVGVGARRIRELFKLARNTAPCIVFIDELDAVGSRRSATDHSSVRMTLNQLLVELDGFKKREGIVVLCATNFPESLDPALTRPGRLDKTINVPLPDFKGRLEILKLYSKKILLEKGIDLTNLAKRTVGMTGADLFNILNLAAIKCASQQKSAVTLDEIEEAYDRIVVGMKGKSLSSDREKKATAYHEGGHTLVSLLTPDATRVHKATIAPRGRTLGATWKIPEEKSDVRMKEMHAELDVLLGGLVAEEIIYGRENVTTGCQNDLERATEIARSMVMKFGVGLDSRGPMHVDAAAYPNLSQDVKSKIDAAVQAILDQAYNRAHGVILENIEKLHNISQALVQYETLDSKEISQAIKGQIKEIGLERNV
ncbi:bifunctional AAA+ ATPase domain/AAA ATPase [Babesia duncani]|uniref:Bifunctional AAA+ ATPase domain/AAA ATPase n=1 Tax=Babesia duncani TaxID=323732 RepID=A0AAD9PPL6_9APIC|nr:bifunctional AAA+ ATPase domain/AAA ATPase [Babesia duncani]